MNYKEWRYLDKTNWIRGEWDNEPDKAQWIDDATGLPCLAVRASFHWCGYVGVTEGHPLFRKLDDECDLYVHGGITFTNHCDPEGPDGLTICHIPEPGQSDHVWWLGFDCAHAGDYTCGAFPKDFRKFGFGGETYRTLDFVKSECAQLAQQLATK